MSTQQTNQYHIFFFPYLAPGHMNPMLNMARLFATRSIHSTIITTPLNTPFFVKTIELNNQKLNTKINLLTLKFPTEETGLPKECENADCLSSPELLPIFLKAIALLQNPFEILIKQFKPNCLIVDSFFPWANFSAQKFGIPCLSFHGSGYFSQCIISNLLQFQPHDEVSSDSDPFVVPNLPHEIKLTRLELAPTEKYYGKNESPRWLNEFIEQMRESQKSCYGIVMNSFYELEPDYADYYGKTLGMKHWHIGPLCLYFKGGENGANMQRGKKCSIEVSQIMNWLDGKRENSVIYICFGSMSNTSNDQIYEIAGALESLGQNFILVIKNKDAKDGFLDGFEERTRGQGLVIRGWAPQDLILAHQAIGGFVTHCGWNSILEGVAEGLPMVTWPHHAEQFYNEKFMIDVLRIGVPIGVKRWIPRLDKNDDDIICKEDIMRAITKLLVGKEAQDMKNRAIHLQEMAKRSIDEGGSSYNDLNALILELMAL